MSKYFKDTIRKALHLYIAFGILFTIGFFPISAQVKIEHANSYSSTQVTRINQKIDYIQSKSTNQKRLLDQKKFSSYDEVIKCLEDFKTSSRDIIKYLNEVKDSYYKIERDKISPSETQKLKHQLEDLIVYTNNLILDIEIWNPSIANQPLILKSPEQIVEESKEKDPCPLGDCSSCNTNCTNPSDQVLCDMEKALCESKLAYCMSVQLLKQVKCRKSQQVQNLAI